MVYFLEYKNPMPGRCHQDSSTGKFGLQQQGIGHHTIDGRSLQDCEHLLSMWVAGASVDKTREAGTTGSPKQDIAELPSSALAPQEELGLFWSSY